MADTPDIGRLVGLIMENPELIEQISALARREDAPRATDAVAAPEPSVEEPLEAVAESASLSAPESRRKFNRNQLLSAMKPYLSEERCRAIDSMTSIVEILEVMRRR